MSVQPKECKHEERRKKPPGNHLVIGLLMWNEPHLWSRQHWMSEARTGFIQLRWGGTDSVIDRHAALDTDHPAKPPFSWLLLGSLGIQMSGSSMRGQRGR